MEIKPVCKLTHRQILKGTCPWCDLPISGGQEVTDSEEADRAADRIWNIDILEADLDDQDCELRMGTVGNLSSHGPPVDLAIPLLGKALHDTDDQVRDHACLALSRLGSKLPHEQVAEIESRLAESDQELALRLLLVGYYFLGQRRSKGAGLARRSHILWLIEHAAEFETAGTPFCFLLKRSDPDGYEQAQRLWMSKLQANPDNAALLANAASFFTLNDSELSEQLLQQGRSLQPENPYWAERLGRLYALRSHGRGRHDATAAALSFAAFEEAEQLKVPQQAQEDRDADKVQALFSRLHALPALARSACDAAEFEQATNYAAELLSLAASSDLPEFFRNDGDAIHQGNLVLGCVALEMGDLERAKRHLLASGKTKGSPGLVSFGPNMSLAKDLLERGERQVVLEYFALCSEFWQRGADRLDAWTVEIEQGQIPDFGANLVY